VCNTCSEPPEQRNSGGLENVNAIWNMQCICNKEYEILQQGQRYRQLVWFNRKLTFESFILHSTYTLHISYFIHIPYTYSMLHMTYIWRVLPARLMATLTAALDTLVHPIAEKQNWYSCPSCPLAGVHLTRRLTPTPAQNKKQKKHPHSSGHATPTPIERRAKIKCPKCQTGARHTKKNYLLGNKVHRCNRTPIFLVLFFSYRDCWGLRPKMLRCRCLRMWMVRVWSIQAGIGPPSAIHFIFRITLHIPYLHIWVADTYVYRVA
jgi:hypothetical protein